MKKEMTLQEIKRRRREIEAEWWDVRTKEQEKLIMSGLRDLKTMEKKLSAQAKPTIVEVPADTVRMAVGHRTLVELCKLPAGARVVDVGFNHLTNSYFVTYEPGKPE